MATRKNASPNPALKNNNTGWGGGSTPTRSTGLTGLPRTTGAHYSANSYAATPAIAAGAGETWTLSAYFQNNTGVSLGSKTIYFVCKKPGDDFSITTTAALPTGVTRVSITGVTLTGTTGLYMLIDSFDATLGSGVEITGVLFEKVGALDTYFDGDTASAVWDGTDGNSSSTLSSGSDVIVPDPANGGAGASGASDGRALGDSSGAPGAGGAADGRALGTEAGSSGAGGASDGRTLGDASGGAGSGSTDDGRALGDSSGGAGTGGGSDGLALSGGASGGVGGGGAIDGLSLGAGSGAVGAGGSPDTVSGPVVIQDRSGGIGAGGHPDVPEASQVVHDTMVMPVLLSALACMQDELAKVASPPAIYAIRPGDSAEPGADPWFGSECCAGLAWVRMVSSYESDVDAFPDPLPRGRSNGCPPDSWGVVVELGVNRCVAMAGDYRGTIVTPAQSLADTQAQMDDGAALRRVLCCLRELYDNSDVSSGQVNPLPIQGGCGGVVLQVTVRRNACDC